MVSESGYIDKIGFLDVPTGFHFDGGTLTPIDQFEEAALWVRRHSNDDGFVYPPVNRGKTELLQRLPPSHVLCVQRIKNPRTARTSLAGFIMHCFGYLYGTRLQFWDWWHENRVPIKSTINVHISAPAAEQFLSNAIATWKRLDSHRRLIASNMLFLHCRAGSAQWDWDKFLLEYIVNDACFEIAHKKDRCNAKRHKDQIDQLCATYDLASNVDWISQFVALRNDLFHKALWDNGHPFSPRTSVSWMAAHHLRQFNHRLITAIFSGPSEYSKSTWWYIGPDIYSV
jgi:hypothetical protein